MDDGQITTDIDFDHRQVGFRIVVDQLRNRCGSVRKRYFDLFNSIHDMVVRNDQPATVNNDPGPHAVDFLACSDPVGTSVRESLVPLNVDNRWFSLFDGLDDRCRAKRWVGPRRSIRLH